MLLAAGLIAACPVNPACAQAGAAGEGPSARPEARWTRQEAGSEAAAALVSATGAENGAVYYSAALNSFVTRRTGIRRPYRSNVAPREPTLSQAELHLVTIGAHQRRGDLYGGDRRGRRLVFAGNTGTAPWTYAIAVDPHARRPYVQAFAALHQATLNAGRDLAKRGRHQDACSVYGSAARMARHLRDAPGSITDIELGARLEARAVHYLEVSARALNDRDTLRRCSVYAESIRLLGEALRRKYGNLALVSFAVDALLRDPERVWRIEAATALGSELKRPATPPQIRLCIIAAFICALADPEAAVRVATERILQRLH